MLTRTLSIALAAVLATLLTVALAPPSSAAYELGGKPHQPTGTASKRTAVVMESAPRMTLPRTWATQKGSYRAGSTVTLECAVWGTPTFGRGSANISGGFSGLWYRLSDGYFVADVHLDTGSNGAITKTCPVLTSNVNVTTTSWQRITSRRTGAKVAIYKTTATDGTSVRTQRATSRATQQFRFIRDEFGTYRIVSATRAGQVLTVRGKARTSAAGAGVVTKTWSSYQSQRWLVRKSSKPGYVTIRPRSTSKLCLTVQGSGTARLTVERCGKAGQLFKLDAAGTASTYSKAVSSFYSKTYGRSIATPTGQDRGICRALTENYLDAVYGVNVSSLGDYVPGGGDGAGELRRHGLTWKATSSTRSLKQGDIVVFRSTKAGQPGHVGIWYNGRLYDQNNRTRSYFSTARLSSYPVPGMKLVGYWRA